MLNVNVSESRGMKSESESIVSSSLLPLSTSMNGYGLGCGLSWVGVTLDAVDNVGEGVSGCVCLLICFFCFFLKIFKLLGRFLAISLRSLLILLELNNGLLEFFQRPNMPEYARVMLQNTF